MISTLMNFGSANSVNLDKLMSFQKQLVVKAFSLLDTKGETPNMK